MSKQTEKQKYQALATVSFSVAIIMFATNAGLTQAGNFNYWNWLLIIGGLGEIVLGGKMLAMAKDNK